MLFCKVITLPRDYQVFDLIKITIRTVADSDSNPMPNGAYFLVLTNQLYATADECVEALAFEHAVGEQSKVNELFYKHILLALATQKLGARST